MTVYIDKMDAAAEIGRNSVARHQIQHEYGDEQTERDGLTKPVSRDQILRREREQGNMHFFPVQLDDHEQDWQPRPTMRAYIQ